jgi:hypothetical protein
MPLRRPFLRSTTRFRPALMSAHVQLCHTWDRGRLFFGARASRPHLSTRRPLDRVAPCKGWMASCKGSGVQGVREERARRPRSRTAHPGQPVDVRSL